jgi:predicted acyl esterase
VRHVRKFVQRHEEAWPIPRTRWTKLHVRADGHDLAQRPQEQPAQVSFEALGDGLTFLTRPFDEETEFTGPLAARLAISSDRSDADLFLILRVFSPNFDEVTFQGASDPHTPVAQGWLRATHRKLDPARSLPHRPYHSHDELQPLVPGQVYPLEVELWPTSIVVPKGYRIGLSIRGRDYEYPNASELPDPHGIGYRGCGPYVHPISEHRPRALFGGVTTLHFGAAYENSLLLPLIPPKRGDAR